MPKKVDRNQPLAVAALRALGLLVQPTHTLGKGAPDFIVLGTINGETIETWRLVWVELKCGKGKLTTDEAAWHQEWGQRPVVIVTSSVAEILKAFRWTSAEIIFHLDRLPLTPLVQAALRAIERRDGEVSAEIVATIEFD